MPFLLVIVAQESYCFARLLPSHDNFRDIVEIFECLLPHQTLRQDFFDILECNHGCAFQIMSRAGLPQSSITGFEIPEIEAIRDPERHQSE